jgi:ribosomal protein L12E/L44/L45/RPP1/RPP2
MKPTQANLEKRLEAIEAQARRESIERAAQDLSDAELEAIIREARQQNKAWYREKLSHLEDSELEEICRQIDARPIAPEIEASRQMHKRSALAAAKIRA